jgi:predicted neuraminidase
VWAAALPGVQYFSSIEKAFCMNMDGRNFKLRLFGAWLVAVAFVAAGYKIFNRSSDTVFATAVAKTSSPVNTPNKQPALSHPPRFDARFISSSPGKAVHAPSIVELRDGGLRAVWFSGSREGAGDVTVQTAVLDMAKQRWSAETTLFTRQQLERGLWRYVKKIGNPVIARAADGSLNLWMVNVSLGGWAGSAITWTRSVDEGLSWSAPKRLVTSPFLNISTLVKGAPVAMADGSLRLPIYHEFVTKFGEVLHINARGQVTDKTRIPGSQTSLQPVVLVTSPVEAVAYLRAGQGGKVVATRTSDAGKNWAQASTTNLPNPDSALAGLVSSFGEHWLALNPTAAGRQSLALFRANSSGSFDAAKPIFIEGAGTSSEASGSSLSVVDHAALLARELKGQGVNDADIQAYVASAVRQLCSPTACTQEFSYPYLLQTRDGSMHLVYTWHRSRIKHVRLGPALD